MELEARSSWLFLPRVPTPPTETEKTGWAAGPQTRLQGKRACWLPFGRPARSRKCSSVRRRRLRSVMKYSIVVVEGLSYSTLARQLPPPLVNAFRTQSHQLQDAMCPPICPRLYGFAHSFTAAVDYGIPVRLARTHSPSTGKHLRREIRARMCLPCRAQRRAEDSGLRRRVRL